MKPRPCSTQHIISILVVLSATGSCLDLPSITRPAFQYRLVGGAPAELGRFPWQVWLDGYTYVSINPVGCGGSLITWQHVLTAAHCVRRVYLLEVTLGAVHHPAGPGEGTVHYVPGYRAQIHPEYNEVTDEHDIALVTLLQKVVRTPNIYPIRLAPPWMKGDSIDGKTVVVSGFGKTKDNEPAVHPSLQYARLRILQHQKCEKYFKSNFNIIVRTSQICTTYIDRKAAVCSGDSGGPLVMYSASGEAVLVGVVSLGVSPCQDGEPSIYSAVAWYLPWIDQHIQGSWLLDSGIKALEDVRDMQKTLSKYLPQNRTVLNLVQNLVRFNPQSHQPNSDKDEE